MPATTRYVSNVAIHGTYVIGNDSNNGLTPATAKLTLTGALAASSAGDTIVINPTSTSITVLDNPYSETAPTLTTRAITVMADPLYVSYTGTIAVAGIRSSSSTFVLQTQGSVTGTVAFIDLVLDMQSVANKIGLYCPGAFNDLQITRVRVVNSISSGNPYKSFAGACNITITDCVLDSTCLYGSGGWFNFASVTSGNLVISGGTYAGTVSQGKIFNGASSAFTNVTIQASSTGTPTVSGIAWFFLFNTVTGSINMTAGIFNDAYLMFSFTVGATVGTLNVTNVTFTPGADTITSSTPLFVNMNEAIGLGTFTYITGAAYGNSGVSANYFDLGNGTGTPTVNHIQLTYNGTGRAFVLGTDDWSIDKSNTVASSGGQNLGDTAAHTYLDQIILATSAITVAGHCSYPTAYTAVLKKTGAPVGTVYFSLYADSAGVPGTLIATSETALDASLLTTSYKNYNFGFDTPPHVAAGTKVHSVLSYVGTNNSTDYVIVSTNATVTVGSIQTSTDGITWSASTGVCTNFWLLTGSYGIIDAIVDKIQLNSTLDNNASITHMCCMGAQIRGTVKRSGIFGGSLGILWKGNKGGTALNPAKCFRNFVYQPYSGFGSVSPFISKGSNNVSIYNNTFIGGSAGYGYAVKFGPTTQGTVGVMQNIKQSTGIIFKNNIVIQLSSSSTQPAYALTKNAIGVAPDVTIDNNDVYCPNGAYIGVLYNTASDGSFTVNTNYILMADWQAAGYDTAGLNEDPLLPSNTPTIPTGLLDYASAFNPAGNSPVKTAGTTPIDATDFYDLAVLDPASIGAFEPLDSGTGQVRIAVTGTAVRFPYSRQPTGLKVTALSTNSGQVLLGHSGTTNAIDGTGVGHLLPAGKSVNLGLPNANLLYLNGTAGNSVSFVPAK